jgi:GH15 family glucan-1,4-alpha-glucosidase
MDSMYLARRAGLDPDENAWRVQRALMDFLESAWREPDEGIWEVRGPRRHFTRSKIIAWVAADRIIKAVERFGLEGPVERWRAVREIMRQDVLQNGFDRSEIPLSSITAEKSLMPAS